MKKIAIIGGGLFGITSYLILRSLGYNCILFEKNKEIMMGASTNNLNRVHYGYHYPRDNQTAKQSYAGHKSFVSFYKDSIIKNFSSYYLIAKNKSLINFSNYLKFCKKNKLPYKFVNNKNFITKTNGIEGIIKVNEPIYSWSLIKKIIAKKLDSIEDNMIFTEEEVIKVSKIKKHFLIKTSKNTYTCEYIIDASYMSLKCFINKSSFLKKTVYQIVIIPEIVIRNLKKKIGIAIMDGPFLSFLPKGNEKTYLLYHVNHSIVKYSKKLHRVFLKINKKKYLKNYRKIQASILKTFSFFLPNLNIKFTKKFYISKRVIYDNKTDRRTSSIIETKKNFFLIYSAKVDHSVDIALKLKNILEKRIL
jgi:hypothetical protein